MTTPEKWIILYNMPTLSTEVVERERDSSKKNLEKTSSFPIYMGCFEHTMHHGNRRQGWQIVRKAVAHGRSHSSGVWNKIISPKLEICWQKGAENSTRNVLPTPHGDDVKGRRCVMEMIRALWREFIFPSNKFQNDVVKDRISIFVHIIYIPRDRSRSPTVPADSRHSLAFRSPWSSGYFILHHATFSEFSYLYLTQCLPCNW